MVAPLFLFKQHSNSFSVKVSNLEELSVEQIQQIQNFVEQRKGIFDFSTYTFVIQKRLTFEMFCKLMKYTELKAISQELSLKQEPPQQRIGFGKYKGLYYSEVPSSYLEWLKCNYKGSEKSYIDAEIKKRSL